MLGAVQGLIGAIEQILAYFLSAQRRDACRERDAPDRRTIGARPQSTAGQGFPDRIDAWTPELRELIPSYGETLNTRPEVARETIEETASALAITAF